MSVTFKAGEKIPRPVTDTQQKRTAEEKVASAPAEKKATGRKRKATE